MKHIGFKHQRENKQNSDWTVVVGSVDRLKICHHMKAVENK
jgi:hypothetical protein